MGKEATPAPVVGVPGSINFGKPGKSPAQGRIVRFAVPPRVGDSFYLEQNSARSLDDETLHVSYWKVVEVTHELNFHTDDEGAEPLVMWRVTVHPQ